MGSRPRPLRQRPLLRNHRCPHGLRLLLLPVPHADGDRGPEPLRSVGATPDLTLSPTWTLCPRRAEAPGRRPCHPNWPAQPRHPPHPAPHRTAAGRGLPPDPRRPLLRWRRLLLLLPGQGWEDRSARATCARRRGAQSRATGTGPGPGGDEAPPSLYGASRAVRSTRSSNGTSGTQGFPRPASTSSGTPPQSSAVTRERVLRTCLGSWITPLWR